MYYLQHYVIDWEKVETLEDVKSILKKLHVSFEPNADIEGIEHMLVLKNKQRTTIFTVD